MAGAGGAGCLTGQGRRHRESEGPPLPGKRERTGERVGPALPIDFDPSPARNRTERAAGRPLPQGARRGDGGIRSTFEESIGLKPVVVQLLRE